MPTLLTDDGLRLHVHVAGDDSAPTVVLVHGLAGSVALSWQATAVLDRLTFSGLRVVALDLRGHGQSDAPPDVACYEQNRFVSDVMQTVGEYASSNAVIVGYSLGAALTLLAFEQGLTVRSAIIAGAAPSVLRWTDEDERRRVATIAALEGSVDTDPDLLLYVAFFESIGANLTALAGLFAHHRPVVEDWNAVRNPVTVVAGRDDLVAAAPEEVAGRLSLGRAMTVPGDHITAPATEEFARLVATVARGDEP